MEWLTPPPKMGMMLQPELSMEMQQNGNVFNVAVCPLHNLGAKFEIKQRKESVK